MTGPGKERKHVGVFGGSFNPPHVAHLIVAEIVRQQFGFDRILWVPNNRSPLKAPDELAGVEDRLAMTRGATAGHEGFAVSEIETGRRGPSYMVDTLRMLQERNPGVAYRLITGGDGLAGFDRWRKPEEILQRAPLVVFPRSGHTRVAAPAGFENRVEWAEAPLLEISGADIRARIRLGQSVRYMVPDPVWRLIEARGLYR